MNSFECFVCFNISKIEFVENFVWKVFPLLGHSAKIILNINILNNFRAIQMQSLRRYWTTIGIFGLNKWIKRLKQSIIIYVYDYIFLMHCSQQMTAEYYTSYEAKHWTSHLITASISNIVFTVSIACHAVKYAFWQSIADSLVFKHFFTALLRI